MYLKKSDSINEYTLDSEDSYTPQQLVSPNDDIDEIAELNTSLKRSFSLKDAFDYHESRLNNNEKNEDEATVERIFTNRTTGELNLPPDGGYGWVNVFCVVLMQFSTWGAHAGSTSVLLAYYIDNEVFPGATRLDFAWIAGIVLFGSQVFVPFGMISANALGAKRSIFAFSILFLAANILAAQAKTIWQLYLTQGVMVALAMAPMFSPMTVILPRWFLKKRAFALSLALSGTGLGGLVYSFVTNAVINATGDQKWAIRIVGISAFCLINVSNFASRATPKGQSAPNDGRTPLEMIKDLFATHCFKDVRFYIIFSWYTCTFFGYCLLVYSFASYATAMGFTQTQGSTLGAIINASQVVGRPLMGAVADRVVGRVNYTIFLSVLTGIFVLGFWMNAVTYGSLIALAICFGFMIGIGNVMNVVILADTFGPSLFISCWSYMNCLIGVPLIAVETIALKLRDDSLSNPYVHCQIFVGVVFLFGGLSLVPLRETYVKQFLLKKREEKSNTVQDLEKIDLLLSSSKSAYFKRLFYLARV